MKNIPKNYFHAIAIMIGYIIGVGMFSLPYVVAKAGLLAFFILLAVLAPVQYLIHLLYANMIIVTKEFHRLPGYAGIYLGKAGKRFVFVVKLVGNYGALLAYIIITGIFLHELLAPYWGGSEFFYASLLFALEAVIIYFGIGMIARAELIMTALLLLVVGLIAWRGWGAVEATNYSLLDWRYLLLPYGAMLFSLDGNGAIPIVAKLLKKDKDNIKSVVRIGTFLPVMVIIAFTLVVVGISGPDTTAEALKGVGGKLSDGVIFFSLIFGILTMVTSFFGVAEAVKETLWWDYKINKRVAWALSVFVPYALYVCGIKNLINVISFAGAVAGGLSAIVMVMIFRKLKRQENKLVLFKYRPPNAILYFLIGLFIIGLSYEVYFFLTH